MQHNSKILLIGTVKRDPSRSMALYEANLKNSLSELNVDYLDFNSPNLKLTGRIFRAFERRILYPLKVFLRANSESEQTVFHVTDQSYSNLIPALPKGKRLLTVHDIAFVDSIEYKNPINPVAWVRKYMTNALKKSDHFVTPSKIVKNELIDKLKLPESKITVVPNALHHRFIEESKNPLPKRPEHPTLLHVGSCIPRKNVETVLKVVKLLSEKHPDLKFVQCGGNFTDDQKKLITKLGIEDRVSQFSNVSLDELISIYKSSSVLLFPSLLEGFGWPVMEALAIGIPVVCSNTSSLSEVGGGFPWKSDPKDTVGLAEGVNLAILEKGKFSKENILKAKNYSSKFTWNKYAKSIDKIYKKLKDAA